MISKEILFNGLRVLVKYTPPDTRPVHPLQITPNEAGEMLVEDALIDDMEEFEEHAPEDACWWTNAQVVAWVNTQKDALWQEVLREARG